jgi:hypothetical protein
MTSEFENWWDSHKLDFIAVNNSLEYSLSWEAGTQLVKKFHALYGT